MMMKLIYLYKWCWYWGRMLLGAIIAHVAFRVEHVVQAPISVTFPNELAVAVHRLRRLVVQLQIVGSRDRPHRRGVQLRLAGVIDCLKTRAERIIHVNNLITVGELDCVRQI